MKRYLHLTAIAILLATATGCVSHGWQGLIPDKDVELVNPILTVMTPYGQQTLRADRLATRVNGLGTNAVGSQALPPLVAPVAAPPPPLTVIVFTNIPPEGIRLYQNSLASPGTSLPLTPAR